jgi:hypothetical protein
MSSAGAQVMERPSALALLFERFSVSRGLGDGAAQRVSASEEYGIRQG